MVIDKGEIRNIMNGLSNNVIEIIGLCMDFKLAVEESESLKEKILKSLQKKNEYTMLHALKDINLNIPKGEILGIVGSNGSGKSTLLRIIAGALKQTKGQVIVDKKKVQLLTLGTGFDPQLTAKENVYLNGALIGYSKEYIDENYQKIVDFAELQGFMNEKVKNFSSGMISRLGFSIATAGDFKDILVLDEVLSVGDIAFRRKSGERIHELIHGGATVLMVSHSIDTILNHCSRTVWLEKGEIRMEGNPKEVCKEYRSYMNKK